MKMFPLVLCAVLFSCSTQEKQVYYSGLELLAEAKLADMVIQSGDVAATFTSIPLTSDEIVRAKRATSIYAESRELLEQLTESPLNMYTAYGVIRQQHTLLRSAYMSISNIVAANWNSYPIEAQVKLSTWQQQAFLLEAAYESLLDAHRAAQGASERERATIDLLSTLAKIALTVA